jgi:hypothetical protein
MISNKVESDQEQTHTILVTRFTTGIIPVFMARGNKALALTRKSAGKKGEGSFP